MTDSKSPIERLALLVARNDPEALVEIAKLLGSDAAANKNAGREEEANSPPWPNPARALRLLKAFVQIEREADQQAVIDFAESFSRRR